MTDQQFWLERWKNQQIAFHQDEVNAHLQALWPQLAIAEGSAVFVPLCGKSQDQHWIAERGHPAVGVEISPIAAEALFTEHGLAPDIVRGDPFSEYRSGRVRVLCGDFFDLQPVHLAGVALVHDRAALIALPPSERQRYAAHMAAVLPSGSITLLITYDYPQEEMSGPPYSVSAVEVERIYGPSFYIELHRELDGLTSRPRFQAKGLTRLTERVHLLRGLRLTGGHRLS